ncbi:MAG: YebC/PmpR family DNA-binding transcriptional regulator [Proteobacteria bacterium]|nr:YebC/PmpR family DNA-binding transcriptional regulator [Pseudomonadota bacterium]
MAGHSQFKNIMHRKGAQDAKRARIFARLAREIMVAAKSGTDANSNPRLRAALAAARGANMPKDNVERAIKKATGDAANTVFEEIRYEGYGPNGIAVVVEALTDNRNRTASEIRSYFSKNGGSLGETGSVSFMFERLGLIKLKKTKPFDDVFEEAVNAGADNMEEDEDAFIITTSFEQFATVRDTLTEKIGDPLEANVIWNPLNTVHITGDSAQTLLKMIDQIENNDDVQNVFCNAEFDEDFSN